MKKKNSISERHEEPLSKDELRMLKSSIDSEGVDRSKLPHYDNSDKARLFRYAKKNKAFTVVCILLVVCVITLLVICGGFAIKKALDGRVNTDDFTVYLGDEKYTVKYKDAMRNEVLYVDMYKIAKYADLIRSGSSKAVKFTSEVNSYLRFEDGLDTAVINGSMVELGGKATVNDKVCEIPFNFLVKTLGKSNGLKLSLDEQTNTIKIKRIHYTDEDGDIVSPVEILFHSDSFQVLWQIQRLEADAKFDYGDFDVNPYLENIDPKNSEEYLILANKENSLGEAYVPSDLVALECRTKTTANPLQLRVDAAEALNAMMAAMKLDGISDVYVTSAYRSYVYQVGLFDKYVQEHLSEGMTLEEAETEAEKYSARAGTSEHQTGLCVDFMTDSMTDLDESFENTAAFRWLSANAHKFGFILRYPSDKVDVTEYQYEPWHYRFVGRKAATEIYNSELCLEEYLDLN